MLQLPSEKSLSCGAYFVHARTNCVLSWSNSETGGTSRTVLGIRTRSWHSSLGDEGRMPPALLLGDLLCPPPGPRLMIWICKLLNFEANTKYNQYIQIKKKRERGKNAMKIYDLNIPSGSSNLSNSLTLWFQLHSHCGRNLF